MVRRNISKGMFSGNPLDRSDLTQGVNRIHNVRGSFCLLVCCFNCELNMEAHVLYVVRRDFFQL